MGEANESTARPCATSLELCSRGARPITICCGTGWAWVKNLRDSKTRMMFEHALDAIESKGTHTDQPFRFQHIHCGAQVFITRPE